MKAELKVALNITGKDIKDHYVVLKAKSVRPPYRELHYRIGLATDGFGCNPHLMGKAVMIKFADGDCSRWERWDIERFATDQEVEEAKKFFEGIHFGEGI